ncbi:MAG: DNA polymerase III subunit delta, partial [Sinobacterium sp.]|nr:DNA polymerase III subunit delta [Sinobacterium sp.]
MKLKPEQLQQNLKQGQLSPLYFISGDETLLTQEACDSVRMAARKLGFLERELFHLDTANASWHDVLQEANSLSLFSDKKIIEVRCKSNKLGDNGSKAIQAYLDKPNTDNLLLITTPKLESAQSRSKWVKAIEASAVHVQVWPIDRQQLPRWILSKMQQQGLQASPEAIEFLADNVEGNLLAAKQEIDKLSLIISKERAKQVIDIEEMSSLISSSSRYTVFNLCDRCLSGDLSASLKTLYGLRNEGGEPTLILWSLTRELRTLHKFSSAVANGQHSDQAMRELRIFQNKQRITQQASKRLSIRKIEMLLRSSRQIDQTIKGTKPGSPWLLLEQLCQ